MRIVIGAMSATAVFLTGCYHYTREEMVSFRAGTTIRLHVTDDGSVLVAPLVGPRIELLDGELTGFEGDSAIMLELRETTGRGGAVTEWAGEPLRVPRRAIASAERKERSPQRSAIVAAGVVGAVIAIAAGFNLFGSLLGGHGQPKTSPK